MAGQIVYVNLCLGFPLGDPEALLRAIAGYFGRRVRVIVDGDDDPSVVASEEDRERAFRAIDAFKECLEEEGCDGPHSIEEALAAEFPDCTIVSLFDGQDTVIGVLERWSTETGWGPSLASASSEPGYPRAPSRRE